MQAEDTKFLANKTSTQPIAASNGDHHVLVPFTMEDGGRLGDHAQAFLKALATSALAKDMTPPLARRMKDAPYLMQVSMWVRF
jgi:hypothetical protein